MGIRAGGYILGLYSDNTTALSWMLVASRTKNPLLQGLARLGSALLVRAAALLTKVVPLHIPGVQNIEADALSHPVTKASPSLESLESVILRHSQLRTCHVCLLPFELLDHHDCIRDYLTADRGKVRRCNDQSFDSRANHFVDWCRRQLLHKHTLVSLNSEEVIHVLATYLYDVILSLILWTLPFPSFDGHRSSIFPHRSRLVFGVVMG